MNDNRKLHIVILGDERSIHVRRWVLGLRGLGHTIDLITLYKDQTNDIGGIGLGANGKISYLLKINALKKIAFGLNPDIFHAHFASSFGFLSSFVNHPRKVLSIWGEDLTEFPYRNKINKWMSRRALQSHNQLTITSEFLKNAMSKISYKLPPVSVIAFGVDTKIFEYFYRPHRPEVRIGIAKHLYPVYGIDTLIKAFSRIEKQCINARLIIGGAGPKENEYKQLVSRLGLEKKICFAGRIDHAKMPEFYNSIDIAAMPSRSETESFGVAAIEASATGLPVVGTNIGGIPEVIQHGVTGYLAGVDNIDQIAEYLIRLIKDPDLRKQMGLAGRKMVQDKYEWTNNLIEMQELYYKMVKS